jgi:hypothetical protein
LRSIGAVRAVGSSRTLRSHGAFRTLGPGGPLWSGGAFGSGGAYRSRRDHGSGELPVPAKRKQLSGAWRARGVDAVDLVRVVSQEGVQDAVRFGVGRRPEHRDDDGEG